MSSLGLKKRNRAALVPSGRDLEREVEGDIDPWNPFPEPVALELTDVFDLHSIQPRDVSRVVTEYLREAYVAEFRSVRIIHGKGAGVQREIVRAILARTEFVVDFGDAPPEAGGWGATIAHLTFIKARDISAKDRA